MSCVNRKCGCPGNSLKLNTSIFPQAQEWKITDDLIINRMSRAPIYHTRWQHWQGAYYNTTHTHAPTHTHMTLAHTHTHSHTHTHTDTHTHTHTRHARTHAHTHTDTAHTHSVGRRDGGQGCAAFASETEGRISDFWPWFKIKAILLFQVNVLIETCK